MTEEFAILELRTYVLKEGTRERFEKRLREVTMPIYTRLGLRCDGFWATEEDPLSAYYTLYWKSQEEMEQKWAELMADPEFLASRENYDSPVVEHNVKILYPVGR